jgi:hypothetical protein
MLLQYVLRSKCIVVAEEGRNVRVEPPGQLLVLLTLKARCAIRPNIQFIEVNPSLVIFFGSRDWDMFVICREVLGTKPIACRSPLAEFI